MANIGFPYTRIDEAGVSARFTDSNRPVLLLIGGQSNSVGRIAAHDVQKKDVRDLHSNGLRWNGTGWEALSIGQNTGGRITDFPQAVGGEIFYATYHYQLTGNPLYIAKFAIGGHALTPDNSQTFHPTANPSEYGNMRDHFAGAVSNLSGQNPYIVFVWTQGENDGTNQTYADQYGSNVANPGGLGNLPYFMQQIQADAGFTPDALVITGHSESFTQVPVSGIEAVRSAQIAYVNADTSTRFFVDPTGLPVNADYIHGDMYWQEIHAQEAYMAAFYTGYPNPPAPALPPSWTAAEIIDEDTVRLTASTPVFFQPSKFSDSDTRPSTFTAGAYGFTLSLASVATDEVLEVRAIDWNSGFGTNTVDLTLNRKLWPDDVLTIDYDNTGHDFQNSEGMMSNVTGLVVTNSISASIAGYRYVDPAGNDSANGLTPGTAWATWLKVETELPGLPADTAILFKRGETWTIVDINVDDSDLWFGAYGTGARPILDNSAYASGASAISVGSSAATSNVRIAGFRYEGVENPATNGDGGRFVSFSAGNCTNCYVSHSYINKGWNSILTLRGGDGIEYVGVEAYNAANSNLWIGGSKSATELAENCVIRDCISIKNAAYAEEDCLVFHAESDGGGNTPMNTAFVGTGNMMLRCYGEISGGAPGEQPCDNTYGSGNLIQDCYFYNANTGGTGITVGWSGNNAQIKGCYVEAALGVSAWRDTTIENSIFNVGAFMILRSKVETDGNSATFDPAPTWNITDCSLYTDNRHTTRDFIIGWIFDTGGSHTALNVSGLVIESTGITAQLIDYANDGPDLDISAITAKNTWDRLIIRADAAGETTFAQDINGNLSFSGWITAESATNCQFESNGGGNALFTNAGGSHNRASDFVLNSAAIAYGAGGNGANDDFYYGKARNASANSVDAGALQSGYDYTTAI